MQNEKKDKKGLWIGLAAVIIIIIAAAVGLFLAYGNNRDDQNAAGVVLDDGAEDWDGELKDMSQGNITDQSWEDFQNLLKEAETI